MRRVPVNREHEFVEGVLYLCRGFSAIRACPKGHRAFCGFRGDEAADRAVCVSVICRDHAGIYAALDLFPGELVSKHPSGDEFPSLERCYVLHIASAPVLRVASLAPHLTALVA